MHFEKRTAYQYDEPLLAELYELIAPSYASTGKHILHDIELCDELYALREETGRLAAFFMVGYHELNGQLNCYLGLSACREEFKGQRLVSRLYNAFLADCRAKELEQGQRILLYSTTVRPEVFSRLGKALAQPSPDAAGRCSAKGLDSLRQLAEAHYAHATWNPDTPYLLRGAAIGVRYSESERERIAEVASQQPDSFFNSVALNERNGDRLLVVGYTPRDCDKPTA